MSGGEQMATASRGETVPNNRTMQALGALLHTISNTQMERVLLQAGLEDEDNTFCGFSAKLIARCLIYAQYRPASDGPRTVVSVGSGSGALEQELSRLGVKNIICCDPAPGVWRRRGKYGVTGLQPAFATVQDLVKAQPELVNNVVLLLPWCNPNESSYDIEAVIDLRPASIVSVYETKGAAGGFRMHRWLESQGLSAPMMLPELPLEAPGTLDAYTTIYQRQRFIAPSKQDCTALLWLARGSLPRGWKTDRVLQEERPSDVPEPTCTVM
jgi:hypothetical protein